MTEPNLLVIGAMKCGTSALHGYLAAHPEIAMSSPKELNFFIGPAELDGAAAEWTWQRGNWHRGLDWYRRQFEPAPVRGEASPGYTSPAHPEAAERIARVLPAVRLVYLVRDPVSRAVSQYWHHREEGTERRPLEEAVLDPGSQYLARSCFHARLRPYLARFPGERIFICSQEELLADLRAAVRRLLGFLGVDDGWAPEGREHESRVRDAPPVPSALRARIAEHVRADAAALRALTGRDFPGWTV